jgi:copper chaperone CopZ
MKHTYEIQNIRCGGCANTITKALTAEFEGVTVDVASKTVTVELKDESEIAKGADMLKKLGYPLADEESGMVDKAKSFVSCAIGKFGN